MKKRLEVGLSWALGVWFLAMPWALAYTQDCANDEPPPPCPMDVPVPTCPDCEKSDPICADSDSEGTSIKPSRANKKRNVTDLSVYGPAPIPFTRIYNSRTLDWTTNHMEFGWKQTWQHNWDFEMRDLTSTTMGKKDVKLRYASGSEFNFKAVSVSGGVVRAPYAYNGDRLYEWDGDEVGHTLVRPDGWEYDFRRTTSPRYQLERVRDGQGSVWELFYGENGRVERIENNGGRWLEIEREEIDGHLCVSAVEANDGRRVEYVYTNWVGVVITTSLVANVEWVPDHDPLEPIPVGDGEPILVDPVLIPVTNWTIVVTTNISTNVLLTGVMYPDGTSAEYTYVGSQCEEDGRPLLATASDPMHPGAGARIRLAYNYDFILDFGNGPYLVTGVAREERNLDTGELVVELPTGSGQYPQVLLGDGTEVTHKYSNGLLVERRDGEGRPTYYTRDQGGEGFVASSRDADGNETSFARDYAGRLLESTDPLGHTNAWTYNAQGGLLSRTDPLGNTTTYTRDTNNWLTRIDYPDGGFESWTRDGGGRPLTHLHRNGGTSTFAYYATNEPGGFPGDLKTRTDPLGHSTTYEWTPSGLPAAVTDARGNTTRFAHDWRGQLLAVTNADGTARFWRFDAFGNLTNAVDELGRTTTWTYDSYARVTAVTDPLGRTTSLEYGRTPGGCGCGVLDETVTRITDPAGKVVEYAYDRSGRRTNETLAAGTPAAATTAWTYDNAGRLSTQLDANGNLHTWYRDASGRVTAEANAWGASTLCDYDPAGRLTNLVDGAGTVLFAEYDALGRRTAVGSGDTRHEYAYDAAGRYTSVCTRVAGDIASAASFEYDLGDRLLSRTDTSGWTVGYAYDAMGARTNLSVPGILDIAYTYDSRGRLAGILGNGKATAFAYDAAGHRTNAVWPNGTTASYAYDAAGQLLSLDHRSPVGTPIATFAYAYDLSGNRTAMTTLEGPHAFTYDAQNQLLSAAYPDGSSETFFYDPVGNRTSLVAVAAGGLSTNITIYTYGSGNRLLSDTSETATNTYAYDGAGRLTNHVVNGLPRTIAYDFQGRMTTLTDTNGAVFRYTFDAEGNRRSQSLGDCLETRFLYDGPDVLLELDPSNAVTYAWIDGPGIDQPIERIMYLNGAPRARRVFHADALGSIAALTAPDATPVQTYAYSAFGTIRSQTGPDPNRVTYTAREQLGDTEGVIYYRNRSYLPSLGRFTSSDPFGFIDGANTWNYTRGNPTGRFDPLGLAIVHNNTDRPVLVSGNIGEGHGSGAQVYGIIPPGEIGGGVDHPVCGYKTPEEACCAYEKACEDESQKDDITDIDFYINPITGIRKKIIGDNLGPDCSLSLSMRVDWDGAVGGCWPRAWVSLCVREDLDRCLGAYLRRGAEKFSKFFSVNKK